MMFTVFCKDKEDVQEQREKTIQSHIEYVQTFPIKIVMAGPLLDVTGQSIGSLLIIDSDSITNVKEFIEKSPFALSGLWCDIKMNIFKPVIQFQ